MATDMSKLRRKRTSKRNVILNVTLVEIENLIHDEENDNNNNNLFLHKKG